MKVLIKAASGSGKSAKVNLRRIGQSMIQYLEGVGIPVDGNIEFTSTSLRSGESFMDKSYWVHIPVSDAMKQTCMLNIINGDATVFTRNEFTKRYFDERVDGGSDAVMQGLSEAANVK